MTTLMVWVLMFKAILDDRPPRPLHEYTTEKACQAALDDVLKYRLASEEEVGCARVKKPQ
jgi:hypothetical protein